MTCTRHLVKIGRAVVGIYSPTDKCKNYATRSSHNTPLAYRRQRSNEQSAYLDFAHGLHDGVLDVRRADDVVVGEEVIGDGDESVLRPALEPVHRAARDETGKLQRPTPELLAHLTRAHTRPSVRPQEAFLLRQ